ncbi:MAG: hypothetical protein M1821_004134 [Bathelium mastoideum]|nr:MAG: hypothetical protein M1821_004134 [Bathelium mastoideum]
MEFEVSYELENAEQFWDELDDIVSTPCDSEHAIDNSLRSWLSFSTKYKDEYLPSDYDVARCSLKLTQSVLFTANQDYVRRQIVYSLLQEDDTPTLHLITTFLLFDGRANDPTFEMMKDEGAFPRLVELIQTRQDEDPGLHRLLLELLYEMSRIQQLRWEDLMTVDDNIVLYLFRTVESISNDVHDPYHYPIIRLVLNEQYMVAVTPSSPDAKPVTNRVIKILSSHGTSYKTFGENLILLLNRESETSLQLLILKLLYLLFTTPSTQEYFYTNDLHVLVDVMIRNLLDLPDESAALRHTYLRVLHPLLAHTQLRYPPHYKRHELQRLFHGLGGADDQLYHFAPIDATTLRLVGRCIQIPWLRPAEEITAKQSRPPEEPTAKQSRPPEEITAKQSRPPEEPTAKQSRAPPPPPPPRSRTSSKKPRLPSISTTAPTPTLDPTSDNTYNDAPSPSTSPSPPPTSSPITAATTATAGGRIVAARLLGMHLSDDSQLSVAAVAAHTEKPGVKTPSRSTSNPATANTAETAGAETGVTAAAVAVVKPPVKASREKPLPPIPGREGRGAARTEARNYGAAGKGPRAGLEVVAGEGMGRERSPFSTSEDEREE